MRRFVRTSSLAGYQPPLLFGVREGGFVGGENGDPVNSSEVAIIGDDRINLVSWHGFYEQEVIAV